MSGKAAFPSLKQRTIVLILNLAVFYAAFVITSSKWLPTGGLESVWLLSAVALWFLTLLSAPWFLPPRDSISKTILSQCNTFLTHSLIDQTSLNFLQSVYSSQHASLIPNLPNLHFLAFGKALAAERPIILRREFDQAKKDASDRLRQPLPEAGVEGGGQPAQDEVEGHAADTHSATAHERPS